MFRICSRHVASFAVVLGLVSTMTACGGSGSANPTAPAPTSVTSVTPTPSPSPDPTPAPPAPPPPTAPPAPAPPIPTPVPGRSVTMSGWVRGELGYGGTCPSFFFTLYSRSTGAYIATPMFTDTATTYSNGSCADLVLGQIVDVTGELQADRRTVYATSIKISNSNAPAATVR